MRSVNPPAEMWPSGRRRSPAKGVGPEGSRGFESHRLRHPSFDLKNRLESNTSGVPPFHGAAFGTVTGGFRSES